MELYVAIYNKLLSLEKEANIVLSGTQLKKDAPYITFQQISCVFDGKTTCKEKYESYLFQIDVYALSGKDCLAFDIEAVLNKLYISVDRIIIESRLESKTFTEEEPGWYHNSFLYRVDCIKKFDERYKLETTNGENIFNALFQRFSSSIGFSLRSSVSEFVTSRYGKENWNYPFLFIPELEVEILHNFGDTCGNLIESNKFSICFETDSPVRDYRILDEIDYLYSLGTLNINNQNVIDLQWIGNDFVEESPLCWCGKVNYELMVEKLNGSK